MNQLFNVVNFVAVPAGGTVSLPHGLNEGGVGVIPDEIKRRSSGNFTLTADATNVTATNNGGAPADCQVLCERWHSIERELGVAYTPSDLSPQPWETDGDAEIAAAPVGTYVFRPGAVGADAPGGNVYTDFAACAAALASTQNNGIRVLEFDSRFSPFITTDGRRACLIPEGEWDMEDVRWTNYLDNDSQRFATDTQAIVIEFADGAVIENLFSIDGSSLYLIGNSTTTRSIQLYPTKPLFVTGGRVRISNSNPLALPLFDLVGPAGSRFALTMPDINSDLGGYPVAAAPLIDVSDGNTLIVDTKGGNIVSNILAAGDGTGSLWVFCQGFANPFGQMTQAAFTAAGGSVVWVQNTGARMMIEQATIDENGGSLLGLNLNRVDTTNALFDTVVTLPAAGPQYSERTIVKDVGGIAGLPNRGIIVACQAGDSINGVLNGSVRVPGNYGSIELCNEAGFVGDGLSWWVVAKADDLRNNYGSAVAPAVGDDVTVGYQPGSVWIDTVLDDAWICLDGTAGAAVWKKTTP